MGRSGRWRVDNEEAPTVDTQEAREQLEQVLRELDAATSTLEGGESGEAGESNEPGQVDSHAADAGSDITDLDRQNAVLEAAEVQRAEVQAALGRLDAGIWGTCTDCGSAIPPARLEVRPEAARCVDCQGAFEQKSA